VAEESDHDRQADGSADSPRLAEQFSLATLRATPRYTFVVAIIAALGGMLFGYDIGVISGAEKMLKSSFHLNSTTEERPRRRVWRSMSSPSATARIPSVSSSPRIPVREPSSPSPTPVTDSV